jgi:hypothetical protein
MAKNSPERMRQFYREKMGVNSVAPDNAAGAGATGAPATPPPPASNVPPAAQRVVGQVYPTSKGPAKWTGQGWQLQ